MAPADMSTLTSAGSSGSNGSTYSASPVKIISNGTASSPKRLEASKLLSTSGTVLSPPSKNTCIKDGVADSYDDVRQMLCTQPPWSDQNQKVLLEPYEHLASRPGKEIRSQMIDAFNIWLKVPDEKIKVIHKVIGMLHTSSLLVDDVEDDSILRRGAPVAHLIYGIPQTINTANYVYFLVFGEILSMTKGEDSRHQMKIQEMIVEEMINLHRGQGMDLYWRDNLVCPTESEYIEMVNNKTSGLLRIVIKLMIASSPLSQQATYSDLKEMLIPLINMVGLLFQIRDDYMNLQSGDYAQNKGYCEDLTEGKFSFPLIHTIRASSRQRESEAAPWEKQIKNGKHVNGHSNREATEDIVIANREDLLSILQSRPKDAATKRRVVEYMEKQTASFEYSRNVMARLDRLVQSETTSLEEKLGKGESNLRLRGILAALRKGWC